LWPTIIARKVSFGSWSEAGAHGNGTLIAMVHTLAQRNVDEVAHSQGGSTVAL
jgi:hypothetical protein